MFVLSCIYLAIMLFFAIGIVFSVKNLKPAKVFEPISVIIAAKNEEKCIKNTVQAVLNQNYPNFELIVADDNSIDKTFDILKSINNDKLKIVKVSSSYKNHVGKKNAIIHAINISKHNNLAFCDADCIPNKNWLKNINNHFAKGSQFIIGYSPYIGMKNKFLQNLKNIERLAISAVSAGASFYNWGLTCVARNMAYKKDLFLQNGGFNGIHNLLSGDDDLLIQKLNPSLKKISFMFNKNSFVITYDDNSNAVNRETRRASKLKYYSFGLKSLLIFTSIYYFYLSFFVVKNLCLLSNFNQIIYYLAIKTFAEFLLIFSFCLKTKQIKMLKYFLPLVVLYVPYYIFFGIKGTFGKYKWKQANSK